MSKNVTLIQLQSGYCFRLGGAQICHFGSLEEGDSRAKALLLQRVLNKDQFKEASDLLRRLQLRKQEEQLSNITRADRQRGANRRFA
jgi:hypothetical protein